VRVGTRPFKADQWKYFYPCEDFSDVDDGVVLDPYDGKVKCIFLDDDQEPLSRKGGVATLTNHLIGKPSGLGNFRAKLHPKLKGFRAELEGDFLRLTKMLAAERKQSQAAKRKRDADSRALIAAASESSKASYEAM